MTERPIPAGDPVLTADAITVAFAAGTGRRAPAPQEVVHGVSFGVERGRVLALVGESGSGKSVTAMALMSLLPRNAVVGGSARLAGEELIGAPVERLRRIRGQGIAAIFQEPANALNPVFRIGDQIAEAVAVHQPDLGHDDARRRVLELLERVGVQDPRRIARSYPHETSGGQLQRAMIAMAISNDPAVLIADEPTTALDVTVQAGILDLLRRLTEEMGTAILLITHDMGVVADLADDVAVMRDGVIVETAAAPSLFASPTQAYTQMLLAAVPKITTAGRPDDDHAEAGDSGPTDAVAELINVTITYGSGRSTVRAVDEVSLSIAPGEFLGLVGESGSGKSTVGRALAGLVPIQSGHVRLGGTDVGAATGRALREVRSRLGIVFQDPASSLNPRHTVGRSVAEPLGLHGTARGAAARERVAELLDRVRLPADTAGRLPHELSGGQRQRVALARALVDHPALLIADEPTSALDVSVQATVLELLAELQRDLGFACLFISHDLAVVGAATSRVAVMHDGRIVETGPTGVTLSDPHDDYTRRLLASVPVADPIEQRRRREAWRALDVSA